MLPVLADVCALQNSQYRTQNGGVAGRGRTRLSDRREIGLDHRGHGNAPPLRVLLRARNHAIVYAQGKLRHVRMISANKYVQLLRPRAKASSLTRGWRRLDQREEPARGRTAGLRPASMRHWAQPPAPSHASARLRAEANPVSSSGNTVRRSRSRRSRSIRAMTGGSPERSLWSSASALPLSMAISHVSRDCSGVEPPPISDSPGTIPARISGRRASRRFGALADLGRRRADHAQRRNPVPAFENRVT